MSDYPVGTVGWEFERMEMIRSVPWWLWWWKRPRLRRLEESRRRMNERRDEFIGEVLGRQL